MGLFRNLQADSSEAYKNSFGQIGQNLEAQKELNKKYTGNQGYQNSIQQGLSGANVTAANAGNQATSAARNAGMNRARAAQLGAENASNAYSNNFANQQNMAANMGNQAIGANQALTSGYMGQTGLAQGEKQNVYGRAANNAGIIRDVASGVGGLLTALSDERCKNIEDECTGVSKLLEGLDTYVYKYKDEAQESFPNETNDKENIGPMAQQLEKNPLTGQAVDTDENGIKHVNGGKLALAAISAISDLSKRLSELEGDEE